MTEHYLQPLPNDADGLVIMQRERERERERENSKDNTSPDKEA